MVTGEKIIKLMRDGKIPEDMPCGVLVKIWSLMRGTGHHGLGLNIWKMVAGKYLDQAKD